MMIKHKKIFIPLIIFALIITLFLYMRLETYLIQIKQDTIISKKIPASFNNYKIVFLADIHHGPYFSISRVKNVVNKINALKPDLILLGGDYISKESKYIIPCFKELSKLKAKDGVFAVAGNHDHWADYELTLKAMKDSGIKNIDNFSYWITKINDRIKIGGVGDYYEDTQDIDKTIFDVKEKDFVILISHNPDYAERIKTKKIDLVLSGHTHGGQITFFSFYAPYMPVRTGQKYRTGTVKTKYSRVIITNGIGTSGPPLRFFARPQINVITLKNN